MHAVFHSPRAREIFSPTGSFLPFSISIGAFTNCLFSALVFVVPPLRKSRLFFVEVSHRGVACGALLCFAPSGSPLCWLLSSSRRRFPRLMLPLFDLASQSPPGIENGHLSRELDSGLSNFYFRLLVRLSGELYQYRRPREVFIFSFAPFFPRSLLLAKLAPWSLEGGSSPFVFWRPLISRGAVVPGFFAPIVMNPSPVAFFCKLTPLYESSESRFLPDFRPSVFAQVRL